MLLKRRKVGQSKPSSSISTASSPNASQINPESKVGLKTTITISFPEIEDQLPEVWGLAQSLAMEISLADSHGTPLPHKRPTVLAGRQSLGTFATNQTGRAKILYTFNEKGEHIISCLFDGDPGDLPSKVTRTIRIVDYREEIVSIFNSLIGWANSHVATISKEATPREIQTALARQSKSIDHEALERVIWSFEEADYSTHPIGRAQYVTMIISARRVQESAEA